ncbi:Serine/threonine-protein phosphatase 6 regulatory ankyrin repeat subunit B [Paramyrothecium foliicola]|nr:Serine/threonine-protein phosphatase 6 regulatory ankyrin repeat subunit B [Paramyrothecium foliicola]
MMMSQPTLSIGVLDGRGQEMPLALVTEWNDEFLRVVCPYCLRLHCHGIGAGQRTGQTRVPHCGHTSASYRLYYPFEPQAQLRFSYKIDKQKGSFVTVGVALPDDDLDESDENSDGVKDGSVEEEDHQDGGNNVEEADDFYLNPQTTRRSSNGDQLQTLEDQFGSLSIEGPAIPERPSADQIVAELMHDPCYRQTLFNSHCITNDLSGVISLLSNHKEDPFVSWRDDRGANCIALAAVEGHHEIIEILHKEHGDLNNVDKRGRTPLMEAALWGRQKAVDYLLQHGADPHAKDHKGRNAYFYSRPSKKTVRMREVFDHYQESLEAETNRRIIAMSLQRFEHVPEAEEDGLSNQTKRGFFVTDNTGWSTQIRFYEQSTIYDVPDRYKTVARLDRGKMFPIVSATSGWRTDFAVGHVLDNRMWRDHVLELCHLTGYSLPLDDRDESGLPGSYNASHAEKKLIAYYINEHFILPSNLIQTAGLRETGQWAQRELGLQHLVLLAPSVPRLRAGIRVSRVICSDCDRFISHVRSVLGIDFMVEHC